MGAAPPAPFLPRRSCGAGRRSCCGRPRSRRRRRLSCAGGSRSWRSARLTWWSGSCTSSWRRWARRRPGSRGGRGTSGAPASSCATGTGSASHPVGPGGGGGGLWEGLHGVGRGVGQHFSVSLRPLQGLSTRSPCRCRPRLTGGKGWGPTEPAPPGAPSSSHAYAPSAVSPCPPKERGGGEAEAGLGWLGGLLGEAEGLPGREGGRRPHGGTSATGRPWKGPPGVTWGAALGSLSKGPLAFRSCSHSHGRQPDLGPQHLGQEGGAGGGQEEGPDVGAELHPPQGEAWWGGEVGGLHSGGGRGEGRVRSLARVLASGQRLLPGPWGQGCGAETGDACGELAAAIRGRKSSLPENGTAPSSGQQHPDGHAPSQAGQLKRDLSV